MMPTASVLSQRVRALEEAFAAIARTRMAGLPLLNPCLRVEAIDFELLSAQDPADAGHAAGILVSPWFMNLVRLPLVPADRSTAIGATRIRRIAGQDFEFMGAYEPCVGWFETCSLFSPMFEFSSEAAARSVAAAVLAELRAAPAPLPPPSRSLPSRRSFFLGRPAVGRSAQ